MASTKWSASHTHDTEYVQLYEVKRAVLISIMKKQAFTRVQALLLLATLGLVAVIIAPAFRHQNPGQVRRSPCQANLKQISLGIKQYLQDNDEKFPRVSLQGRGWMELNQPYLKSNEIFQCPNDTEGYVDGTTDYFYNTRISNVSEAAMEYITNTIMLGDGFSNAQPDSHLSQLPSSWLLDEKSPAHRHLEGANYAFADGHVKWMKPANIGKNPVTSNNATFMYESESVMEKAKPKMR